MTTITKQDILDLLPIAAQRVSWFHGLRRAQGVCPVCALIQELDPGFTVNFSASDEGIAWFREHGIDSLAAILQVIFDADSPNPSPELINACK